MDFAPSSIRLMASGVEMSGLGAPVRTATPTATVASGVALAATTWPDASTSGNGGCTIGTSNGSPFATCRFVPSARAERRLHLVAGLLLERRDQLLDRRLDAAGPDERDLVRAGRRNAARAAPRPR